jgi:hypothetical protein
MDASDFVIAPERGTSRVLYRRTSATAPPGDWDPGWRSVAIPKFVKFNAAGWCVSDRDAAVDTQPGRSSGSQHSPVA